MCGTLLILVTNVVLAQSDGSRKLAAHADEFREQVIEVTDGVHVAIGFGLANSILIEGDDGLIIVDTMEGSRSAKAVKAQFDKISTKPVKAIIYTHNHYDHINGGKVFAGDSQPEVYAHELTMRYIHRATRELSGAIFPRSMRQFGISLTRDDFLNAGIGPRLIVDFGRGGSFLPPTVTLREERMKINVAGVDLELVHAPGETPDQIYVWLPTQKTLLCGDNYYKAFPNLYAIRGTPYRDPADWVASLDKMIDQQPEFLVPSHTRPILGAGQVHETLSNYRDAIRSVLDQTIAGMIAGSTPDELVEQVRLPSELAELPYLQEFYGTVAWSVRSIYEGNLGWFDGNATHLFPLEQKERAKRMADLAGGQAALLKQAKMAVDSRDFQWAAELCDHLILLDPKNPRLQKLKARALLALGRRQTSANARNYYITSARQLERAARSAARDSD